MPLDEFLPEYDVNEVHSARVAAPPADVLAAAQSLTPREVRPVNALMAVRSLPATLLRRGSPAGSSRIDGPLIDRMRERGFTLLAERPDEVVLGAVGRFWSVDSGIRRVSRDEFAAFDEPGFAKAVMNFHVRAVPGGTVMTTETRVRATDDEARRRFRRYWRVVMPGSALIRRVWLRAIRKRAEANC
jgi:hypothetical protein